MWNWRSWRGFAYSRELLLKSSNLGKLVDPVTPPTLDLLEFVSEQRSEAGKACARNMSRGITVEEGGGIRRKFQFRSSKRVETSQRACPISISPLLASFCRQH